MIVGIYVGWILNLDIKSDRRQIKDVLLLGVAVPRQHMQQVKFLSQKLVAFEVIHELLGSQLELRLSVWVLG